MKISLFRSKFTNSIIDSQRDPAMRKRDLLTWFLRRCYIRFRSWHILSIKLFFFFFF